MIVYKHNRSKKLYVIVSFEKDGQLVSGTKDIRTQEIKEFNQINWFEKDLLEYVST